MRQRQLGGLCGLAFVVLFIIGGVIQGDPPDYTAPASEIQAWFVDNGDDWQNGDYLVGLAFLFGYLPFLVFLRGWLGKTEGGEQGGSRLTLASGLVPLIFGAGAAVFSSALALQAAEFDESTVKALATIDYHAFGSLPLVVAPFLLVSGLVALRTWGILGVVGIVAGALGIVAGAAPVDGDPDSILMDLGFITYILFLVWVFLLCIGMILREPEEPHNF
jgi:hypothetical protein